MKGESKMLAVVSSLNGERGRCGNANYVETRIKKYRKHKELKHIPPNFLLRARHPLCLAR